ncbi:MAG: polysaccharide deacetylase family protein [Firmicutes bacterium]|nr:polysaccharide deacetylase family protein [Bacillota bacterium]
MNRESRIQKRRKSLLLAFAFILTVLSYFLHRQITRGVFTPLIKGVYYHVETEEKAVALTFEVVWEPGYTSEILDILDRHGISCTFFLTGEWIRKNPNLAREIAVRGHEIGQHSYSHKNLTEMDDEELAEDFKKMSESLQEELNLQTNLFRPPYGELDQRVFKYAQEHGYVTVVWSINPHDWQNPGKDEIINRIFKQLHNGAIILLHTNSEETVEALPIILQRLHFQGYKVLTFSELVQCSTK